MMGHKICFDEKNMVTFYKLSVTPSDLFLQETLAFNILENFL